MVKISLLILVGLLALPTHASRDGRPGLTSTGEIVIKLTIKQGIQITNLEDIEITVDTLTSSDVTISKRFCIRSNTDGLYSMTAFSDRGGRSPFSISSATKDEISFELYFRNNLADSFGDQLKPNVPSRQYPMKQAGVNCNGQNNAEVQLIFPANEINRAQDKEYGGFLNLTVAIE